MRISTRQITEGKVAVLKPTVGVDIARQLLNFVCILQVVTEVVKISITISIQLVQADRAMEYLRTLLDQIREVKKTL